MSTVSIRRMVVADGAAVTSLSQDLGYEVTRAQVYERIGSFDNDPLAVAYVALIDGAVVGWIQAHDRRLIQYPRVLEIGGIAVSAKHREKGIGRKLIEEVVNWGRVRGHALVWVRSGAQRLETHQFYEAVGFAREKTSYTFSLSIE